MQSITILPGEALVRIFHYVSQGERLTATARTCKLFNILIRKILWASVALQGASLADRLNRVVRVLERQPDLGALVKRLDVQTDEQIDRLNFNDKLFDRFNNLNTVFLNTQMLCAPVTTLATLDTLHLHYPWRKDDDDYEDDLRVVPVEYLPQTLRLPSL